MKNKTIAVMGGGSWGTVLANLAALNGSNVILWMRDLAVIEQVNTTHSNKKYLPEYKLSEKVKATNALKEISLADTVIFCVPSDSFREIVQSASGHIKDSAHLISATKGVEENGFSLMSNVIEEVLGSQRSIGVLSGPNLAGEIALNQITGTVIASKDKHLQNQFIEDYSSDSFRVYISDDPYGVEMGGALKNIYAIACGIADGLNSGENTIGMIMTRGLAEMSRLAIVMGANPQTFLGLSGVGDLITTCASPMSRNHKMGKYLGQGLTVNQAKIRIGQTTEGLKTLKVVWKKARTAGVEMPIVDSLYKIIYQGESLDGTIQKVLGTDQLKDVEF
jgi:glycerol-3-phosphate dehydrogenase (NAD(P)+)|tara:strand:+ start:914 stop:1918 length:1005 start_codon:yes stop_codon:yes gene_type:complete